MNLDELQIELYDAMDGALPTRFLQLLDQGADPTQRDDYGNSPLVHLVEILCDESDIRFRREILERFTQPELDREGFHILHYAVFAGRDQLVRHLLETGAPAEVASANDITPLDIAETLGYKKIAGFLRPHCTRPGHLLSRPTRDLLEAAESADAGAIQACLSAGANPDGDEWGICMPWMDRPLPLAEVARAGVSDAAATAAAKLLLEAGANVHRCQGNDWNALHTAISHGKQGMAELLLDAGAPVDNTTAECWSVFEIAIRYRSTQEAMAFIRLLLEHGATISPEQGLLHFLVQSKPDVALAAFLLGLGVDVNERVAGVTPLDLAEKNGWTELAGFFRTHGGKYSAELPPVPRNTGTDDEDDDGYEYDYDDGPKGREATPLHFAAYKGELENARRLLAEGADVNAEDEINLIPLHYAAQEGHTAVVALLVEHGADLSAQDTLLGTPLISASWPQHVETVRYLLEHGSRPDEEDVEQVTALHIAASKGNLAMARLLLEHGANVHRGEMVRDATPLAWAAEEGHTEIAALLLDYGADIQAVDIYGDTPLHLAAANGHKDTVALLLARGADLTIRNDAGELPKIL